MKLNRLLLAAVAVLALGGAAFAVTPSTVLDQSPAPVPSSTQVIDNSEMLTQSVAVTGGTLYITTLYQGRANGGMGQPVSTSETFVPTSQGGLARNLKLTDAKSDLGVPMTAAAGTPAGTVGVSRTAGTSLVLVGEATSASANTDKALWELNVADSYVTGQAIPVVVNANYTGTGTVTAATTTLTLAAYTEVNGVETAIAGITAAQQFTGTATNYTFTIPGAAGLVAGQRIAIEVVMLVTTSAGAATGQINAVSAAM